MRRQRKIPNPLPVHIRWMIRRDMLEVLDIESLSFDYPWREDDFLLCLRQRNCIGMVAENGDDIVGFMLYELHKTALHFLNFAVHPKYRRLSIGRQMVAKVVAKLSSHRRNVVSAEIRETNLPAQLFSKACGFKAFGVLHGHYPDTGEDAYGFEYRYPSLVPLETQGASV